LVTRAEATTSNKCNYQAEFMLKYIGAENAHGWVDKFHSDFHLTQTYLYNQNPSVQNPYATRHTTPQRVSTLPRGQQSRSQTPRRRSRSPARRTPDRGNRGSPTRQPRRGSRGDARSLPARHSPRKQVCFSRSDPAETCTYPSCRFSHACAACGENHEARKCPSWDGKYLRKRQ
jgi:hypothetical protein